MSVYVDKNRKNEKWLIFEQLISVRAKKKIGDEKTLHENGWLPEPLKCTVPRFYYQLKPG